MTIPERGSRSVHADALFEGFVDLTYAYRFGPPGHDVVAATLRDRATGAILADGSLLSLAVCPPDATTRSGSLPVPSRSQVATLLFFRSIGSRTPLPSKREGFVPDDNFLHLEPGEPRRLSLSAEVPGQPLRASVSALNGTAPLVVVPIARAKASDAH